MFTVPMSSHSSSSSSSYSYPQSYPMGELSRSSSTSKSRTMANMNPGVQAKLLAFQAKRQQQMKQSKFSQNSNDSILSYNEYSSEHLDSSSSSGFNHTRLNSTNTVNTINTVDTINNVNNVNNVNSVSINDETYSHNQTHSDGDSPRDYNDVSDEVQQLTISPLISKVGQYHTTISSNSPLTPLSLDSSSFSSPIVSPNEDTERNPLSRRTSFRLNNKNTSNYSTTSHNNDDDIVRRTSFRLSSTMSSEIEKDSDTEKRKSIPNSNAYPVNKNLLSKIHKMQSNPNINHQQSNMSSQVTSSTPSRNNSDSSVENEISTGPFNRSNLNQSSTQSVPSLSKQPTEKLSLSQRRGMKLNLNSIHSQSTPNAALNIQPQQQILQNQSQQKSELTSQPQKSQSTTQSQPQSQPQLLSSPSPPSVSASSSSSQPQSLNNSRNQTPDTDAIKAKFGSMTLSNRSNMNKLRENAAPVGRKNPMNLNLNNLRSSQTPSIPSRAPSVASSPSPFQPNGFASYAKYIDVKSGKLNFSGKASLHSKGVDFTNGSSFRISMDDLEILEELGHGNYGVVSKVLHKPTNVVMAMKEVRLELDDSKFSQILMELEVLHSCHTDCIVEFYGAFFVEGAVYMCMEFMKGGSIDKIYNSGIPEIPLAYITKRVVEGLKTLKDEQNIIHRDVKPTNMLVNENGIVKLCDFGVSGNLVASLARTNIGCQSYMAPERIKHSNLDVNTYSVQSDIWSLGLSILEIAKGCYPYPPETYNNVFSQLSAIVDGEAPELPKDKFSNDAQDFVKRCLHKNPNKRPTYSQLLMHPWLQKFSSLEGEAILKNIVTNEIEKRDSGKQAAENNKAVPPLHSGLQM